jgi:hypothetical protein
VKAQTEAVAYVRGGILYAQVCIPMDTVLEDITSAHARSHVLDGLPLDVPMLAISLSLLIA